MRARLGEDARLVAIAADDDRALVRSACEDEAQRLELAQPRKCRPGAGVLLRQVGEPPCRAAIASERVAKITAETQPDGPTSPR
jgi:hypothetical protein